MSKKHYLKGFKVYVVISNKVRVSFIKKKEKVVFTVAHKTE